MKYEQREKEKKCKTKFISINYWSVAMWCVAHFIIFFSFKWMHLFELILLSIITYPNPSDYEVFLALRAHKPYMIFHIFNGFTQIVLMFDTIRTNEPIDRNTVHTRNGFNDFEFYREKRIVSCELMKKNC